MHQMSIPLKSALSKVTFEVGWLMVDGSDIDINLFIMQLRFTVFLRREKNRLGQSSTDVTTSAYRCGSYPAQLIRTGGCGMFLPTSSFQNYLHCNIYMIEIRSHSIKFSTLWNAQKLYSVL